MHGISQRTGSFAEWISEVGLSEHGEDEQIAGAGEEKGLVWRGDEREISRFLKGFAKWVFNDTQVEKK